MEDEVVREVEKAKAEWEEALSRTRELVGEIESCGKEKGTQEANSLPRLNGSAQDNLAILRSLQFKLDLLAQQMPTEDGVHSALSILDSWKDHYHSVHSSLRNANLQAKANIRKAAQKERELLLGGGEESTIRRRNLQTKAGIMSASDSITESLRRTRLMMVQEVERSANTLATFGRLCRVGMRTSPAIFDARMHCRIKTTSYEYHLLGFAFNKHGWLFLSATQNESTSVLKKAESEYKGHRSLLSRTRNLLSTMQRQDILDRIIVVIGFVIFSCAVLYVVSKRIGLLKLQRKVTEAIKDGTLPDLKLGFHKPGAGDPALIQDHGGVATDPQIHAAHMHDEL